MNAVAELALQHLIDPEVCIRCNTCESTCPVGAITHDSRNYVVDFAKCGACNACVPPCPTGAIDHWLKVRKAQPYSVDEQFGFDVLPEPAEIDVAPADDVPAEVRAQTAIEGRVGSARAKAADTLENLEKVFQSRVQRALHQMGVPGSRDIDKLSARVNTLNASIEKLARQRATQRSGNGKRVAATPPPAAH